MSSDMGCGRGTSLGQKEQEGEDQNYETPTIVNHTRQTQTTSATFIIYQVPQSTWLGNPILKIFSFSFCLKSEKRNFSKSPFCWQRASWASQHSQKIKRPQLQVNLILMPGASQTRYSNWFQWKGKPRPRPKRPIWSMLCFREFKWGMIFQTNCNLIAADDLAVFDRHPTQPCTGPPDNDMLL